MTQYLEILGALCGLECVDCKEPARPGLPSTLELFAETMKFDLRGSHSFPLLTCRKMPIKTWLVELCWMLKGQTTIKYLLDRNVHIWDADAYRFYKYRGGKLEQPEWLELAKAGEYDPETRMLFGDLGKIYGYQWRTFGGVVDQIQNLQKSLRLRPNSRYHIVTAWNPEDYATPGMAALPACHAWFQCNIRQGKYLDLMLYQRSCDMILGVPFDIAEYAALTHILATSLGLHAGTLTWVGASCHIYQPHLAIAEKLLARGPRLTDDGLPALPEFRIKNKRTDITEYEPEDFEILDYEALPAIKAELFVGV